MSTHFDIYCDDCQQFMGLGKSSATNGAEAALQSIIDNRDLLLAIHRLRPKLHHEITIDVHLGYGSLELDLEFFEKHPRHRLRPRSEYELDKCEQEYDCSCGYSHTCELLCGHVGDHKPTIAVVCDGQQTRKRP